MSENGILGVECLLIPYNKEMQVKNMIGQSDLTRDQTAPLKIGGLSDMSNQYVFNDICRSHRLRSLLLRAAVILRRKSMTTS